MYIPAPKNIETLDKLNKPHLTIIDDELRMATLLAEVAESAGFEVNVSTSAEQFLQTGKNRKDDLIVIDLFMPETDGFELIKILAEQGCTAAIIFVSGYDKTYLKSATMIAKGKGLNIRNTFTKPFQIDNIKKIFREIYNESA